MAKILCAYSSVLFQVEHFPLTLSSREIAHPIFELPKKKLLSLAARYQAQTLSHTESYLLYLALFNSTGLIEWRTPARYSESTPAIVANNIESLLRVIAKIEAVKTPSLVLPRFAITHDTANLENSFHWIESWHTAYQDFQDGYRFAALERKAQIREEALERLIKSPYTKPDTLANNIADWAATAGAFPTYTIENPVTHKTITLADYWKAIIRAAVDAEKIWAYPTADIKELIEHCEDNIHHGTIYAATLMKRLREGLEKQDSLYKFDDIDLASTRFSILPAGANTFSANVAAAINSAPAEEPKQESYPTKFAYLRARLNWELANTHTKSTRPAASNAN